MIYEYGVSGLMKLAGPVDPSTVEGMLSGAFKRAGVTATAGATSELSRILIDTAAMGNSSEFDLEMKLLRMEGMSAEEAWRQTFTDYVERVVDTGVRSGRYGLIAGLSEYGGEYFRQHPEAFNALVSGKTGWSGGMQGLQPGGAGGPLGLPGATLAPGGRMGGIPMLPGPAAVKDDWETALEEAVAEQGVGGPEDVDISGGNGIIISRGIGGTNGQVVLPGPNAIKDGWDMGGGMGVEGAGEDIIGTKHDTFLPTQEVVNQQKVAEYSRRLKAGERIPPVQVIDIPGKGRYIIDGHHRYVASLQTGIPVEIRVVQAQGPIGMPDWTNTQWREYITEEQFWGD